MTRDLLELRRTERYLVGDAIASGGMAAVHVGVVQGALGFSRVVAVKRLHPPVAADARFVAMLIDEARVVSRIRHVNVVPTLDILEYDGEVFVIMEYVRGRSLARLLELTTARGELVPMRIALPVLVGALRGLEAAHEATDLDGTALGIVHRDVSPQNILVGTGGVARLIDFGVAYALGKSEATRRGEFKGKLSYAAPEQLGEGGTATKRTDLYAVGIILWEMLTGRRLFFGEDDVATFRNAVRAVVPSPHDVLAEDEQMRAFRTEREVDALAPIALRALDRDPTKRWSSAAEMAAALEQALPSASLAEVGAWLQDLARSELEEEQEIITRIEEALPRRPRSAFASSPSIPDVEPSKLPRPANGPRPPPPDPRTKNFLIGLPPTTLAAIALAAAAGAGIGTLLFAWTMR